MTPKEKAIQLISDYSEMQPTSTDLTSQYELTKVFAKYAATTAKWSHDSSSKEHSYWQKVREEIDKL